MKDIVDGLDVYGNKIQIPVSKLEFRPGSYGVIVNDGKIALIRMKSTGKYSFPGGGVDLGETMEEALRREVMEEIGLEIEQCSILDAFDLFFKYTPENLTFHSIQFYYLCSVKNTKLIDEDKINDEEACDPEWVDIASLKKEDFQEYGGDLIERLLAKIS